ncbi:MAG: MOSC domain-containing protein [Myxococcota bacterium]
MKDLGTIRSIHRYPVKSMLGEALDAAELDVNGIPGDRAWGARDELRADFFVGKRSAKLMSCRATYPDGTEAAPQIELPDGSFFRADEDEAARRVSDFVGRDVTLWPVVPEARQATPKDDTDMMTEMQAMMARTPDEPAPDFSAPPPELLEVYARGGPFFDAFPLMLLSQSSIDSIAAAAPNSQIDIRRFRPSLLIDTDEPGPFPEQAWIGRRLQIGGAVLKVQMTCARCIMTTHGFADLAKDAQIMRTLVKEAEGNLGVYVSIEEPGAIRAGDPICF